MSLLVIGTLAYDTIETPYARHENVLGGSAVYFSVSASNFGAVRLVGVVGGVVARDAPDHRVVRGGGRTSACRAGRGAHGGRSHRMAGAGGA